jgi:hypothetical protein
MCCIYPTGSNIIGSDSVHFTNWTLPDMRLSTTDNCKLYVLLTWYFVDFAIVVSRDPTFSQSSETIYAGFVYGGTPMPTTVILTGYRGDNGSVSWDGIGTSGNQILLTC